MKIVPLIDDLLTIVNDMIFEVLAKNQLLRGKLEGKIFSNKAAVESLVEWIEYRVVKMADQINLWVT